MMEKINILIDASQKQKIVFVKIYRYILKNNFVRNTIKV